MPDDGGLHPAVGSSRGTSLFSPERLDEIVRTVVEPETDSLHHFAVVAATNTDGIEAALIYSRTVGGVDWKLQAAWKYSFGAGAETGAKVVVKF